MKRTFRIIAVLLTGLSSGCGDHNNPSVVIPGAASDVIGYVNIDPSRVFDDRAPKAAFDGTNYLVVYQDLNLQILPPFTGHGIVGVFVSPDPAIGAGTPFVIDSSNSGNDDLAPAVAFNGTDYLVVYQRLPAGGTNHSIIGVLVDPAGTVGTPFPIDDSLNDNLAPAVASNGANYLVAYQRTVRRTVNADSDIQGALIDTLGRVTTISLFGIDPSGYYDDAPSVASDETNYLVVYQDVLSIELPVTGTSIFGTLVDSVGSIVRTRFVIDDSQYFNLAPEVASNGSNYLVAYERLFSTDSDIQGAIVDTSGPVPTISPIGIDTLVNFDDVAPSVASDGTNYLVAYQDLNLAIVPPVTDHDIIGARVSSAGIVFSSGFVIDASSFDDLVPAAAFGGTNYLVAYEDIFNSADHDIIGALVIQ